jgi:hypothetical protein
MSSKTELPPCECGSTDVSIGYESPQGYWVECGDCGYQTDKSHLQETIIALWIKRSAPAVGRTDVLPCDVKVAPNTTIKKGCKIETLLGCIELRKDQPDKFTRFKNTAPPELAELQATIAQLMAENERLRTACSKEFQSVEQLSAEIERLKGGQGGASTMARANPG